MDQALMGRTLDHRCPNYRIPYIWVWKIYWQLLRNKHVIQQDISPLCNLCTTKQNDNCLHMLSCSRNKHITCQRTHKHNKAAHAFQCTLLATPRHVVSHWLTPANMEIAPHGCNILAVAPMYNLAMCFKSVNILSKSNLSIIGWLITKCRKRKKC